MPNESDSHHRRSLIGATDDELMAEMEREFEQFEVPLEFVLRPVVALQLAGLLQLALKHPDTWFLEGHDRIAAMFIEHVRRYFASAPAISEALRRGNSRPSLTCPLCGLTSYNVHDIEQGYCGACHRFIA